MSCGSSCTTSAECKTIRIAVSPVMDMPGDFTQGVDLSKLVGLGWFRVVWLMIRVVVRGLRRGQGGHELFSKENLLLMC